MLACVLEQVFIFTSLIPPPISIASFQISDLTYDIVTSKRLPETKHESWASLESLPETTHDIFHFSVTRSSCEEQL